LSCVGLVLSRPLSPSPSSTLFPYTPLFRSIPSALSLSFFTNQDNVWGIGLLLSGLGVAMAMWKFGVHRVSAMIEAVADLHRFDQDRKSTRLNSSHVSISYAVFCLKKKTTRT